MAGIIVIIVIAGAATVIALPRRAGAATTSSTFTASNLVSSTLSTSSDYSALASSSTSASSSKSIVSLASNDKLSIGVSRVATDDVDPADPGETFYILSVTVTNTEQSASRYVPYSGFQVKSSSGAVYNSTMGCDSCVDQGLPIGAMNDTLGGTSGYVHLSPGQSSSGQVAFELPSNSGERPVTFDYSYSGSDPVDTTPVSLAVPGLPAASSTASYFVPSGPVTVTGGSFAENIDAQYTMSGSEYFFSGDEFSVNVTLMNTDTATHTISSLSLANSSLSIVSASPALPIQLPNCYESQTGSCGGEFTVVLTLRSPPFPVAFNGLVGITATASS